MDALAFRRYSVVLAALAVIPFVIIVATASWLLPLRNDSPLTDLVRLGDYSLNRYVSAKPHLSFEPPLFEVDRYDRYADIVVLGDSFSYDKHRSWVNYLAARGWSVVVLRLSGKWSIERLLDQPIFHDTPPKLVIYESIENVMKERFGQPEHACSNSGNTELPPRIDLHHGSPPEFKLVPFLQPQVRSLDAQQIAYARDFLVDNAFVLMYPAHRKVCDFTLTVPRFTNAAPRKMLVIRYETAKGSWTHADLATMRCALAGYADAVQANGRTAFMALLVPDKLSAYHQDLVDQTAAATVIPQLVGAVPIMPRLDLALRKAIEAGELDVYMPSDTHWGAAGHRIAAEVVLDAIDALACRSDAGAPAPGSPSADVMNGGGRSTCR